MVSEIDYDKDKIPDWWQCPDCGCPTHVSITHENTKRECLECSWEFNFNERLAKYDIPENYPEEA